MSGYWEVIAPVSIVALIGVGFLARWLRHPAGGHRMDLARLDATPDTLARWGTVPVVEVAGLPPWAAPEADRYSGFGWNSGSSGSSYGPTPWDEDTEAVEAWIRGGMRVTWDRSLDWAARHELPPPLEATLRRELHHVDDLDLGPGAGLIDAGYNSHLFSGPRAVKVDSPAPAGLPREDGAGDESEACGPPAPPAPLRPVDLALARCDLFMVAMRADHERWLACARERWAA